LNYRIENIIASTNLNTDIDLSKVSKVMDSVEYNPENFPGAIWRPPNSYGVAIIFSDGRLMCTNMRGLNEVEAIFNKLIKRMEELELINPRSTCPKCGAVVDTEDVVCIECGFLFNK